MPVEHGFRPRPIGQRLNAPFNDGVWRSGGKGEPGRRIIPAALESRFLSVLNGIQRTGEKPTLNPFQISDALMTYQDQVGARARGLTPKILVPGEPARLVETKLPTQEDQAFLTTIQHVRQAFDILAFSHFPPNYQQALSDEVYDEAVRTHSPEESITLTHAEKGILQHLTEVAGIPDDPEQLTYSFSSIPHIVPGSERR